MLLFLLSVATVYVMTVENYLTVYDRTFTDFEMPVKTDLQRHEKPKSMLK